MLGSKLGVEPTRGGKKKEEEGATSDTHFPAAPGQASLHGCGIVKQRGFPIAPVPPHLRGGRAVGFHQCPGAIVRGAGH